MDGEEFLGLGRGLGVRPGGLGFLVWFYLVVLLLLALCKFREVVPRLCPGAFRFSRRPEGRDSRPPPIPLARLPPRPRPVRSPEPARFPIGGSGGGGGGEGRRSRGGAFQPNTYFVNGWTEVRGTFRCGNGSP